MLALADYVYLFACTQVQVLTVFAQLSAYLHAHGLAVQPAKCAWMSTKSEEDSGFLEVGAIRVPRVSSLDVLGTQAIVTGSPEAAVSHRMRKTWQSSTRPLLRQIPYSDGWISSTRSLAPLCCGDLKSCICAFRRVGTWR